jgi:hypothetical protein
MQIIKLSQTEDRDAWLEGRRGLITGAKAKGIKLLNRGTDRTPAGFWELLAENLAIAKDGESERDRGLRLQNDGLLIIEKQFKLKLDLDPGFWVSDIDPNIAISPDASEIGNKPVYAAETKSLDSKNHLKLIINDCRAKKLPEYNPFNSLKIDSSLDFQDQALQYFVVNEKLKTLYFGLYDDRIALEHLIQYTIIVERKHVQDLIEPRIEEQKDILKEIKLLIKELKNAK